MIDKEGFQLVQKPSKKRKAGGDMDREEAVLPRPRGRPPKISQKEAGQQTLLTKLKRTVSAGGKPTNNSQGGDVLMTIDDTPSATQ